MSSVWTRPNGQNVAKTPATEGGEYASQSANPGHVDGAAFVRQLIGDGAQVSSTGRSIEYWSGDSMTDTGLAYNISGRATVIEAGVGERLAGFEDPIKAIFGTAICTDKTVMVKRKYVVGGAATITPERAPARTVQVREDVTTVELQRYGGDVTMNTNLFLRPEEAKAEMDMKLDAQKRQLENKLVELGYNEIFDKALRLPDVAVRSNPTYANQGGVDVDSPSARAYARTVYFRSCFGAFSKHEFPLANMLASCKTSGAYTSADGPGTVLVIPHGSSEMLRYTKASSMNYSISGLRTADQKPVTMSIDNVTEDPSSGVKIMVHVPPSSYSRSAALPSTDKGMLSEDVTLYMYYPDDDKNQVIVTIPDLENGSWKTVTLDKGTKNYPSGKTDAKGDAIVNEPIAVAGGYLDALAAHAQGTPMTAETRRTLTNYLATDLEKIAEYAGDKGAISPDDFKELVTEATNSPMSAILGQSETHGFSLELPDIERLRQNAMNFIGDRVKYFHDLKQGFLGHMFSGISEEGQRTIVRNTSKVVLTTAGEASDPSVAFSVADAAYNSSTIDDICSSAKTGEMVAEHVSLVNTIINLLHYADSVRAEGKKSAIQFADSFTSSLESLHQFARSALLGSSPGGNARGSISPVSGVDRSKSSAQNMSTVASAFGDLGTSGLNETQKNESMMHFFQCIDQNRGAPVISGDFVADYLQNGNFSAASEVLEKHGVNKSAEQIKTVHNSTYGPAISKIERENPGINATVASHLASTSVLDKLTGGVVWVADSVSTCAFYAAGLMQVDFAAFKDSAVSFASSVPGTLQALAQNCYEKCSNAYASLGSAGKGILGTIGLMGAGYIGQTLANNLKERFNLESLNISSVVNRFLDYYTLYRKSKKPQIMQSKKSSRPDALNTVKKLQTAVRQMYRVKDAPTAVSNLLGFGDTPEILEKKGLGGKDDFMTSKEKKEMAKVMTETFTAIMRTIVTVGAGGLALDNADTLEQYVPASLKGLFENIKQAYQQQGLSGGMGVTQMGVAGSISKPVKTSTFGKTAKTRMWIREMKLKMSSAIIAKSGSDTGELLVGYPMTGVSTNQRTESMTVALRVYLGAILKKPENVTIIPHVAFEGIVSHDNWFEAVPMDQPAGEPVASGGVKFVELPDGSGNSQGRTGYAYQGTCAQRNASGVIEKLISMNNGPLGHLDDPHYMECVNGLQVYKSPPVHTRSLSIV